jgi:hypothetical protein
MQTTRRSTFSSGLALVLASFGASCGATAPPASTATPSDEADAAPATPSDGRDAEPTMDVGAAPLEVSFRRDVVPVFDTSCAFSGCHAQDSYVGLLLGPSSIIPPEQTYKELLSGSSAFYGSLRFVVPGQPEQSFLYRKLTGNFAGLACNASGGCGPQMPGPRTPPAPKPSAASIAAVAAWIAMGAPDN